MAAIILYRTPIITSSKFCMITVLLQVTLLKYTFRLFAYVACGKFLKMSLILGSYEDVSRAYLISKQSLLFFSLSTQFHTQDIRILHFFFCCEIPTLCLQSLQVFGSPSVDSDVCHFLRLHFPFNQLFLFFIPSVDYSSNMSIARHFLAE